MAVVECNEVRPAGPRLDLALACLRKDAFEQAVKQCTELGVDRFVPFASDKSHLSDYGKGFFDRLGRVTLAAMKQSFRTTLPRLEPVCQFEDMVAQSSESGAVVVGDSDGGALEPCAAVGAITIVVGPEGGLNAAEREVLSSAGAEFVSASTHRLRSETSAAALTTLVLASLRA